MQYNQRSYANHNTTYALDDWPSAREFAMLGCSGCEPVEIRAIWTGELRFPRKGEWFLTGGWVYSGYEMRACRMDFDSTVGPEYHIAQLVRSDWELPSE